jgi:hypothetical protein
VGYSVLTVLCNTTSLQQVGGVGYSVLTVLCNTTSLQQVGGVGYSVLTVLCNTTSLQQVGGVGYSVLTVLCNTTSLQFVFCDRPLSPRSMMSPRRMSASMDFSSGLPESLRAQLNRTFAKQMEKRKDY